MPKIEWMPVAMAALIIAAGPVQGQEPPTTASTSTNDITGLTIDLPECKRDINAWKVFSPWAYLRKRSRTAAEIARLDKRWRKKDAVDVTWVDIDGDGWCGAVTSGDKEPYKSAKGKPVLLFQPRAIYLRTSQGFMPFRDGMITGEYEGSSFTIYWDTRYQSAVIFIRVYQGNAIGGIGDGSEEFHLRQMLRASFAAHKAGKAEEEHDYYVEVEPFLYTRLQIPRPVAKRIWAEEAQRAQVDLEFPFLD